MTGRSVPWSVAIKPTLFDSGLAGVTRSTERFARDAAQVTRLAGADSAAETAATVQISQEARSATATRDTATNSTLEGALTDMRVAKYQYMASLKVLATGDEVAATAADLVRR